MKKNLRLITLLMSVLLISVLTVGCSGSRSNNAAYKSATSAAGGYDEGFEAAASEETSEEAMYEEAGVYDTEVTPEEASAAEVETPEVSIDRKLIKTVNLSIETEQYDSLLSNIEQKAVNLGGYVESSDRGGRSYYNEDSMRYATYTVRIPKDKLNEFVTNVEGMSNVTARNEYVEDVTLQYVDMESHKKSLEIERERLMELLATAESVDAIIALETRLSEVRYQIESMESQLRMYDNQVDYSTVHISISEVETFTPQPETSVLNKIKTGLLVNTRALGTFLENTLIGLIINLPIILAWAVVLVVIILLVKLLRKRGRKKRQLAKEMQTDRKYKNGNTVVEARNNTNPYVTNQNNANPNSMNPNSMNPNNINPNNMNPNNINQNNANPNNTIVDSAGLTDKEKTDMKKAEAKKAEAKKSDTEKTDTDKTNTNKTDTDK